MIQARENTGQVRTTFPGAGATRSPLHVVLLATEGLYSLIAIAVLILSASVPRMWLALPAAAALVSLALGLWVLVSRRHDRAGRGIATLSISMAVGLAGLGDLLNTQTLMPLWLLSLALAGAAFFELAFFFPRELTVSRQWPAVPYLGYLALLALALVLVARSLFSIFPGTAFLDVALLWLAIAAALFLATVTFHAFAARSAITRIQSRLIAIAMLIAVAPMLIWYATREWTGSPFSPALVLASPVLPAALAYALLHFSIARTERLLRQSSVYILISLLLLGAYALLVTGLSLIFRTAVPQADPLWIAAVAFVLATLLDPLRRRLQSLSDRTLFRGQRAAREALAVSSDELSRAVNLDAIARIIRRFAMETVDVNAIHIFVLDPVNEIYSAVRDDTGRPSSDLRFAGRGPLAQRISQSHTSLALDGGVPAELQSEAAKLSILGAQLILELPGRERLLGWMALGPRRNSVPFSPADIQVLENIAQQAALAIGRVQMVDNLERRVQEMNALARVAQGVNITLTFDDVLELIFAQTGQIIPLSHFHITLYSREGDYFYLAFAVENNERLGARENVPLAPNTGLTREIVRRGRPMLTDDYTRECHSVGATPLAERVFAWMGVPLNAGAESIGAMSVGNREPGFTYTTAQLNSLQAIADQTAGAIVKARLLRETENRAAQLGKLNDITRQLAAIRDLEVLRQNVVEGAMSILDCSAGLFYTLDGTANELTVSAVSGKAPRDAVGNRLPFGTGTAGRAAQTRTPAVDNTIARQTSTPLLDGTSTLFLPRTSLAVPLHVQETVIGVLEVADRRDGSPFASEDESLLMAFAGQAAVALENVRLYTLTDLELAARVEELSVMQRIDRELNASLEMERAMRITLEWALRQSNAEAGLIGLLDGEQLRVVTAMGYGSTLDEVVNGSLPLSLPGFQAAINSGVPQSVSFDAATPSGFLPAADHQVVIPIRREANIIGLLVLESTGSATEDLAFLGRLSDHAAIAISNAQLYDEVQRANIAKSDFVSLVAHELKNPMTSIKGYTELLATGAVGTVNEMQASFLNTIRSNTERMSTLVSDLNDNSKIEAGRLRLDFKAVELPDLVDETVRSQRRQIDEKRQIVEIALPEQLPRVWSDRTRLGQVLTNLVSNANKYTPEGGTLFIGAELSPNLWDPEGARQVIHVWVRDSGIGISPEDQQRIFQKFFRSEDPKAREAPGAGLGLNITRSLVEMQGGRIWFESQYREGTTFSFTVPVAETEA